MAETEQKLREKAFLPDNAERAYRRGTPKNQAFFFSEEYKRKNGSMSNVGVWNIISQYNIFGCQNLFEYFNTVTHTFRIIP